jgi:D-arabinose 1-dehydrogenase-like Zn-dependent alcohol dehydrogenase
LPRNGLGGDLKIFTIKNLNRRVIDMKIIRVNRAGGDFQLTEEALREPARGFVRLKVQACGVCRSDSFTKEGELPGIVYPRAPGHEVAGIIDAIGEGVGSWQRGDRVGVGWFGGICRECGPCRRGDFINCIKLQIPGISYDGGYAESIVVPQEALARIPDQLKPEEAAPLMCAGITTFNALRKSGARPGDLVAIQGIGGLGHLGVQFASKSGFETVAIGRGADKRELALKLGAHRYIDSAAQDIAKELSGTGGAKVILVTAPDSKAIPQLVDGLCAGGKLVIVGVSPEPFAISSFQLVGQRKSIVGWPSGTAQDSEDTLKFAALAGVRPMIEVFPLERAADAYAHMRSGEVRFRSVITA